MEIVSESETPHRVHVSPPGVSGQVRIRLGAPEKSGTKRKEKPITARSGPSRLLQGVGGSTLETGAGSASPRRRGRDGRPAGRIQAARAAPKHLCSSLPQEGQALVLCLRRAGTCWTCLPHQWVLPPVP